MAERKPYNLQMWEVVFSLKTFLAAMLALYLAFLFDLQNPYWAVGTVYITAHPLAGASTSKAVYRLLGTILGGAVSVIIIPNTVDAPVVMVTAMSLWMGTCLAIALLDRSPKSYVFMLASYTSAIIGFPTVTTPDAIFTNATARVIEISLGIIVVAAVSRTVFPRHAGPMMAARIDAWLRECAGLIQYSTKKSDLDPDHRARARKLAAEVGELRNFTTFVAYDTTEYAERTETVVAMQRSMVALLPMISGLAGVVEALKKALGTELPKEASAVIELVDGFVGSAERVTEGRRQEFRQLLAGIEDLSGSYPIWSRLLLQTFVVRVRDVLQLWADCIDLKEGIVTGSDQRLRWVRFGSMKGGTPIHRDYGMAIYSGLAACLATAISVTIWIQLGWPTGSAAAMTTAIVACLFSTADDPTPIMRRFLQGALAAAAISFVLLFGVMPALPDFGALVAVLAIVLLPVGVLIARPASIVIGLGLTAILPNMISFQNRQVYDLEAVINGDIALVMGVCVALVTAAIVRSFAAELTAKRLLKAGWEEIQVTAGAHVVRSPATLVHRMLDRLGLVASRISSGGPPPGYESTSILKDLRNELNATLLIGAVRNLPHHRDAFLAVLDGLAAYYGEKRRHPTAEPARVLLERIDEALRAVLAEPEGPDAASVRIALVGLRYNLFPDADAFDAEGPPERIAA